MSDTTRHPTAEEVSARVREIAKERRIRDLKWKIKGLEEDLLAARAALTEAEGGQ